MSEGTGELGEAQEIARLLQELKSRSGLSYGALAKRLHVSTSALHRYCTGDVMPVEFDPLERFARLCRATPEERAELYRLWVAAHTTRGNRQSSAPAPAPKAPPASEAEAAPEKGPVPEPVAETVADPVTEPVAEQVAEQVTEPEPEPVAEPEPETVAEPKPEPETVAGSVVKEDGATAPASAPTVPSRRGVRRGILAGVTAAAMLATLGAVATGLKPHPGGDPTSAPAPAAGAGPTGAVDRGAGAPITVTVRPDVRDAECDKYLVNRPPSEVPRPPAVVDVPGWAAETGAVVGHYQSIELTVQGIGSETVVLTALNVRIARIAAPLAWNAYSMGEGCGGGVDLHSYDLDLDAARPRPVVTAGSTGLPVKVSERDPEVIEVTAETTSHDVSWYLELEWSSGNRTGTLPIGVRDGVPFRISAVKGRPLFSYPIDGKAWKPSAFQE